MLDLTHDPRRPLPSADLEQRRVCERATPTVTVGAARFIVAGPHSRARRL